MSDEYEAKNRRESLLKRAERNPFVEHARKRKAGPMTSRNKEREGGNRRKFEEEILELEDDVEEVIYREDKDNND